MHSSLVDAALHTYKVALTGAMRILRVTSVIRDAPHVRSSGPTGRCALLRFNSPMWSVSLQVWNRHNARKTVILALSLCVSFLCSMVGPPRTALAQRPFLIHDPLYRSEQPQRVFFGGYALTAEVSYRNAGAIQGDGLQSVESDPLGLSFRIDYQIASRLDLSAIIDAAGNTTRRGLSLSWVIFKYYERSDQASFALRLAVDPSFDSRAGFPQIDVAWLSSSALTPLSSTDFAFGIRRVRLGYEQWLINAPNLSDSFILHETELEPPPRSEFDIIYTRALGWELHLLMGYNVKFDPAGSNLFLSFLGQAGSYDLLETSYQEPLLPQFSLAAATAFEREVTESKEYIGGVIWLRSGIEFNRPSYQISPFIGFPLQQWSPGQGNWPKARRQFGVRLMLR